MVARVEDALRRLEAAPLSQAYQVAIGFLVVPAFVRLRGSDASDWRLFPFFLLTLLAVRLVPAVIRHLLPFSSELRSYWFARRILAKRYDSYQWRKLLWYGLGMTAYLGVSGGAGEVERILALACISSGAAGEIAWRRREAKTSDASAPARLVVNQVPQK